jgi:predicted Holliday junction resolvase-like endonuclease
MQPRLLSNLIGILAIACLVTGVGGLFGLFVALVVLGILLGIVGYLLSTQEQPVTSVADAVEAALQKAQVRHEIDLAGAVSQAEERGREEIRQQLRDERHAQAAADELSASLT